MLRFGLVGAMVGVMVVANASNWLDAPYNRDGFLRVDELTRVLPISRGDGPINPLPRSDLALDGIVVEYSDRRLDLDAWLAETFTDGLLVIHRGEVVVERYSGMMADTDRHLLMSISKSITSLLCGVLVRRGFVSVTDLVTDHLPDMTSTTWDGCTIEHLLDMTAGVRWDYERNEVDIMDVSGYRQHSRAGLPASTASWIRGVGAFGQHGDAFRYVSLVSDVLGWVLERATGQRLETLLSVHLWSQIGAEQDGSIIIDKEGFRIAEGGLSTSLRDLGRLGLMCLEDGQLDGRQIVPQDWLGRLHAQRDDLVHKYAASTEYEPSTPRAFYHDNWWIADAARGQFGALGIHGQRLMVHHPSGTVVVKFSSQPLMEDPTIVALDSSGIDAIISLLVTA
jgi:CubicO group peptidase (beta-lactamase class C family)